jgi:2-polyprenyl-6-methoxyphenol hydroxylase-like FAD-dependent oxidoreductase
MRVVVIGAGLGGLCLAQGLRKHGVDVKVFERDASLTDRPQGYRLHLDGRGDSGLRTCLPPRLYDLVRATTSRPSRRMTVATSRLKTLRVFEPPGGSSTSVDRLTLREILLSDLPDVVRFGVAFTHYELGDAQLGDELRAHFADGSSVEADVLVAADGVGSRVRAQYLPRAQIVDSGDRCIYGRTPLESVRTLVPEPLWDGFCAITDLRRLGLALGIVQFQEPPPVAAARLAPGTTLTADEDYVMWSLAARRGVLRPDDELFGLDPAGLHDLARARTAGWHPQLHGLVEHATPDATFAVRVRTSVPFDGWEPSRVTLLGDAIHAMSPARGSGANLALLDAGELCQTLVGGAGSTVGIGAYEATMRKRGFDTVVATRKLTGGPLRALAARFRRGRSS